MSYSNTYSNGFGYSSAIRQQSTLSPNNITSSSSSSNFLNPLQRNQQRKNSYTNKSPTSSNNWRGNNIQSNTRTLEVPTTSSDTSFLRNTMGSYGGSGSKRPNKQLFQSAALQGERNNFNTNTSSNINRRQVVSNLRHTTGNLSDILRNLNFDKQLREQEQRQANNIITKPSNKYSNDLSNSSHNNRNANSNDNSSTITTGEGFRKQKHTHVTVYESRPATSYEPSIQTQNKKQSSYSGTSSGNNNTTVRKFDIDEMFNKIKREKQLQGELKKLKQQKRLRQQRQKDKERQRQRQKQSSNNSTSTPLSSLIASQKFSSTFSSSSSSSTSTNNNKPGFYTRPVSSKIEQYSTNSYNSPTTNDYQQKYSSNQQKYDQQKYSSSNFTKKQRYGAAYTPKREYQFEKKTYQFQKKYDTAQKKDYDWKKTNNNTPITPSFLKQYKLTSNNSYQTDKDTSYNNTSSKTPTKPATKQKQDTLSKYFSSSGNQKAQKFDCKVTIRDFRLGKQLGEGKFGTVYQAVHKQTNSLYALKKVPKAIIKSHYMIDQFILQLKLQTFMNSQYLLALYGFFHDSQHIYLILDYMQEGTLYTLLKKNKKLQYQDAATKIKQISKGIIYMHENGIAHRDIKPQNVVMSNGSCKLCDFGWSTICDQRRKTYCGTFDYAAPQILQGAQYDMSVDLWCLGVMAFELLVGKAPFYHIKKQQTKKRILNVQSQPITYPNDMPKDAVDFIQRLLKKDPQERIKVEELLYHPFLAKV